MVLNANVRLVHYNAIEIVPLPFELDSKIYDALIFTSQNSVKNFFKQKINFAIPDKAFCVGEKTKELLEAQSLKVISISNAEQLAEMILKKFKDSHFLFLSGKQRLDILPSLFTKNNVRYDEVHVYDTFLTPKEFERDFDGILFFSPSGVKSHFQKNDIGNSIAFCIGPTTEKAAKKYTQKTIVANKPSIENVVIQAIKELRTHD